MPSRHIKKTQFFLAGCNDRTLRSAKVWRLHPRHIVIAGQRVVRHIQPSRHPIWKLLAERVPDPCGIDAAPLFDGHTTICIHLLCDCLQTMQQEIIPVFVRCRKQVWRLLLEQLPHDPFCLAQTRKAECRIVLPNRRRKAVHQRIYDFITECADKMVCGGIDGCLTGPIR